MKPMSNPTIAIAVLLACLTSTGNAFQSITPTIAGFIRSSNRSTSSSPVSSPDSMLILNAKTDTPPILQRWVYLENGSVQGFVKNHPTFDDGDEITTSTLMANIDLTKGGFVKTRNGSQYKLGVPARGQKEIIQSKKKNNKVAKGKAAKSPSTTETGDGKNYFENIFNLGFGPSKAPSKTIEKDTKAKKASSGVKNSNFFMNAKTSASSPAPSPAPIVPRIVERQRPSLNGRSVGNGKYLLAGKAVTSSLKSLIFAGYRTNAKGDPSGEQLTVKLSTNYEALERENRNYNRAANGIFPGAFVNKLEFLTYADGKGFDDYSALIIEAGRTDLRALLNDRGGRGLEGRALRDATAAAGLCIQAMHSSNLVWTDLKAENFVVVSDSIGDDNLPGVKGIDLESAMPVGQNPVDYSPEACPPEFAKAFMEGEAAEFRLDPSYDMWSLGMLLYELSTGTGYFAGQNPSIVTKILSSESFAADVTAVKDDKLQNLIAKCLQPDPRKRPNITSFLLHPYFTTTGFFTWSF